MQRRHIAAEVVDGAWLGRYRVKFKVNGTEKVSIVIVSRDDSENLKRCIDALGSTTAYPNWEILVVGAPSYRSDKHGLKEVGVVPTYGAANFAALVKRGVEHATGSQIFLLDESAQPINADWLDSMLGFSQQQEIGVVGAKLLSKDADVRSRKGVLLRSIRDAAKHALRSEPCETWRSSGRLWETCNSPAVSSSGMMFRRSTFEEVGGFDENLSEDQDIDFCKRVRRAGYRIVWTPWAEFFVDQVQVAAAGLIPGEKWIAGRLATEEDAL
jgi:GT2 family glycosyltransferase